MSDVYGNRDSLTSGQWPRSARQTGKSSSSGPEVATISTSSTPTERRPTCGSTASRAPGGLRAPDHRHSLQYFEVFTRTWADHYILFDQKRVDWPGLVEANRAKVQATPPGELFDILEGMIKPLDDAHTSQRRGAAAAVRGLRSAPTGW